MNISARMNGLKELQKRLESAKKALTDMTPMWRSVGEYMFKRTIANFDGEHAPDGTPWKPLSAARINQRKKRHAKGKNKKRAGQMKILNDTGELRKSVRKDPSKDGVVIGAYRKYAATHQFGRGRIPARPFIGATDKDIETIKGMAQTYILRQLK